MKFGFNYRRIAFPGSALLIITLLLRVEPVNAQQLDGTLKNIKATSTLNLGYLESAPPFSLTGPDNKPAGYSIDLCTRVASAIQKQLEVNLKLNWVASHRKIECVWWRRERSISSAARRRQPCPDRKKSISA